MKRVSITELKKKYKNKNFFLTTFFDNHLHCAAIFEDKITYSLVKKINRTYSVIKRNGTYYIF